MAKKKKQTEVRVRKFSLITYHDEETIKEVLLNRPTRAACYILHDRDVNKDGTPKEPHYHIMLSTKNAATLGQVRRWFPDNQNTLAQVLKDDEQCAKYLTHEGGTANKAPYDRDAIKELGEGMECFRRAACSSGRGAETVEDLINDINNGVSEREMHRRYGRDYIIYREKWHTAAACVRAEERPKATHDEQTMKVERQWNMICELFREGVINAYEFAGFERQFGVNQYNPYASNKNMIEIAKE